MKYTKNKLCIKLVFLYTITKLSSLCTAIERCAQILHASSLVRLQELS